MLTVKQLRKVLEGLPDDMPVLMEYSTIVEHDDYGDEVDILQTVTRAKEAVYTLKKIEDGKLDGYAMPLGEKRYYKRCPIVLVLS